MANNHILVEGSVDEIIIKDIIEHAFHGNIPRYKIENTKGYTNLKYYINTLSQNKLTGGRNFIIFDADLDFGARYQYLTQICPPDLIDGIYLFPDNQNQGEVEDLIFQLVRQPHSEIFDCFDRFCSCITHLDRQYNIANKKSRFYAYLEATGINPQKIDFKDQIFFNLNQEIVGALINFMRENFDFN